MGIYKSEIVDLRKNIGDNIGHRVIIKESPGKRSKPLEKSAIIENTYKDYFRVRFDDADRVGSYNYTDLFTKTIEVKIDTGNGYEPLIEPQMDFSKKRINV